MYAEEDKKKKEAIDVRNQGESLVYETEKTLGELGDKVTPDMLAKVNAAKDALSQALQGNDVEDIKAKTQALTNEFQQLSQILYQNAQTAGADPNAAGAAGGSAYGGSAYTDNSGAQSSGPAHDNVVDADFEVIDDDN